MPTHPVFFTIHSLHCDFQKGPCVADSATPLLSWRLESKQRGIFLAAWQILAASTPEKIEADEGDLWDSGKVTEEGASSVLYTGKALDSRARVFWKVRAWDRSGAVSPWSEAASFSVGLLKPEDWRARWIAERGGEPKEVAPFFRHSERHNAKPAPPEDEPAVYLRKEIAVPKEIVSADLYLCGVGYVEFFIDGRKVGDQVLDPPFTAFHKHLLYRVFDVAALLPVGNHALCAMLGNGFYNIPTPDFMDSEKAPWRTPPKFVAQLEVTYRDGSRETFLTDRTWKVGSGPIVFNCVKGGESLDLRRDNPAWCLPGYDVSKDPAALEVSAPVARPNAAAVPPIRIKETVAAQAITEPQPGVYLVDFGRNLAGWVRYTTRGPAGTSITVNYSESLHPDGTGRLDAAANSSHTFGRFQHQECILAGQGDEVIEPRFTYYAFRYVEIHGATQRPQLKDLTAFRMHTDLRRTGTFACSHPQLNRLHDASRRTLEDCTFGNLCSEPAREKNGYNGDTLFVMDSYVSMFDTPTMFRKHVRDVMDGQEPNGHIAATFPNNGWGKLDDKGVRIYVDDPWWGESLAESARILDSFYGDRVTLHASYEACKRYAEYVTGTAENHIVRWSLGDWVDAEWKWPDGPGLTPVALTSTLGYYRIMRVLARQARFLGLKSEAARHEALAKEIAAAFQREFFDSKRRRYLDGSQTAPALALFSGVVPDDDKASVEKSLLDELRAKSGHLTCGFIGTLPMLYWLNDYGHAEEAFEAVTKPEGSGWFWLLDSEYPTLGETIHPDRASMGSHHHQFTANVGGYLYRCLAGFRADPEQPGFRHFFIRPPALRGLTETRASVETVRGPVEIHWTRRDADYQVKVTVPANSTATLELPAAQPGSVTESGRPVAEAEGVAILPSQDGLIRFRIGSGNYAFSLSLADFA